MRSLPVPRHLLLLTLPLIVASCGSSGPSGTGGSSGNLPANPANFKATTVTATGVTLQWDAVGTATSYTLERKTNTAEYAALTTLGTGTLNYADTGVQPSTTYTYRLKTVSDTGTSGGITVTVTTPASSSTPPNPNAGAIDAYAASLPSWDTFSPPIPDKDEPSGPPVPAQISEGGVTYDCTTTPYGLARTPEKIVTFQPDASVFWPGVLLQGKGYAEGLGSLKELPIRQRAPLAVSIDLLGSDNARTVDNPTVQTVTQAIGQLIAAAKAEGVAPGTSIDYRKQETNSSSEVALRLGLSAKYMPLTVKATLDVNRKANETTITANFIEKAFTVSVVPPQTPAGFFSPEFTPALLEEQKALGTIGPNNVPTYVSSITYGRILLFSFTASGSEQDIKATLDVLYESATTGASAELSAAQKQLLSTASIKVTTVGGDSTNALALIRSGNISDYFESTTGLDTYKPISYEVRNLGDGSIAKISETTSYNVRECKARTYEKIGERLRLVVDSVQLVKTSDDSGEGEIYGDVRIDEAEQPVWQLPCCKIVQDGGTIPIGVSAEKDFLIGADTRFKLGLWLRDDDGATTIFGDPDETLAQDYFYIYMPPEGNSYNQPLQKAFAGAAGGPGEEKIILNYRLQKVRDLTRLAP